MNTNDTCLDLLSLFWRRVGESSLID